MRLKIESSFKGCHEGGLEAFEPLVDNLPSQKLVSFDAAWRIY